MFQIGGKVYEVMINHKNGWNAEAFRGRYSEILERYDYIVGDWGYNQLRLKGMYRDGHPKVAKESQVSFTTDYITEHCNFGCAYFVLRKVKDMRDVKDPEEAALYEDLGEMKEPVRETRESHKVQEAAKETREHTSPKERKDHRGGRDSKSSRGESRTSESTERETKDKTQGHPGKKNGQRGERPNRQPQGQGADKGKASGGEAGPSSNNRNRKDRGGESRPKPQVRDAGERQSGERQSSERREPAQPAPQPQTQPQPAESAPNPRPDQESAE